MALETKAKIQSLFSKIKNSNVLYSIKLSADSSYSINVHTESSKQNNPNRYNVFVDYSNNPVTPIILPLNEEYELPNELFNMAKLVMEKQMIAYFQIESNGPGQTPRYKVSSIDIVGDHS